VALSGGSWKPEGVRKRFRTPVVGLEIIVPFH